MQIKKKIITLCVANFCRSPVAEKILNEIYNDELELTSAGLYPMTESNMDKRSAKFLKSIGITNTLHLPKKITSQMINNCDLILCMDHYVLSDLNKLSPRNSSKFKLIAFQSPRIQIPDPYRFDEKKYVQVMENIHRVCKEINI